MSFSPESDPGNNLPNIEVYDDSRKPVNECVFCGGENCYDVDFDETTDGKTWDIDVRCPDCGGFCTRHCNDEMTNEFEDILLDKRLELELIAKNTEIENMKEWAELAISSINKDLILPMDF